MSTLKNKNSGFALLYAVLLTGVILTISLGLSSILTKQIVLSSVGANSQKAYYAANTIKECVIHWGIYGGVTGNQDATAFGGWVEDADGNLNFTDPSPGAQITCGDTNLDVSTDGEGQINGVRYHKFIVGNTTTRCNDLGELKAGAEVFMYERSPEDGGKNNPISEVIATGYSPNCELSSRRVEREIRGLGEFSNPFDIVSTP
jgi:hypothetical protein